MDYDSYDALLQYVYQKTQGDAWFKPAEENVTGGVCLRVAPGHFRLFPYENTFLAPFEAACRALNPVIAIKVRSAAINAALATAPASARSLFVDMDTRIQILDTIGQLARADREQRGAFVRDERTLVVWADAFDELVPVFEDVEDKLIRLVWRARPRGAAGTGLLADADTAPPPSPPPSYAASGVALSLDEKSATEPGSTEGGDAKEEEEEPHAQQPDRAGQSWWSWKLAGGAKRAAAEKAKTGDVESLGAEAPRPIRLYAAVYSGSAVALTIFFIGSGAALMMQESMLDFKYQRFALLVTAPFLFCVAIFFALQIIGQLSCILGPIAHYHENSHYYSAVKPLPNKIVDAHLPHVTIEMPVYKESLTETIAPSVLSLKKAMQTYARQGGTSAILIHDDGLQLLGPEDREARMRFYADHNIGWVARPKHESAPDGFKRAGRFKKASNMNYGLALSLKLERHLLALEAAGEGGADGEEEEGETLEDRALALAVEEVYEESGRRWKPWAANGKSMRVGEIILIVDSDTIVPEDCLRDAARELAASPEVAIIQHESDVMQVAHHYFENGIAYFTRRVNRSISMVCANGEVAAFVGHNAFLRWSAIQDAAFVDAVDGVKKIWSENNVSEDFDMALRLMLKGYIVRWATYSDGGFKEGVSLTPDDELNRWEKYAFGCNELIFNPLIRWWRVGPINKQLHTFVWSSAPVHYKISMLAYMFSYYGIAISFVLTLLNYLLCGWQVEVDAFYLHSFEIWLAVTVVFTGAGNLGFTMLEYRLGQRGLKESLVENLKWLPFFFFFFGGLSIHLSKALLAHLFSYDIQWGATKKEVERSNFFLEIPKILRRFRVALVLCVLVAVAMVLFTLDFVPADWRIEGTGNWAVLFPLALCLGCHVLYPIVLNPWLMVFSY